MHFTCSLQDVSLSLRYFQAESRTSLLTQGTNQDIAECWLFTDDSSNNNIVSGVPYFSSLPPPQKIRTPDRLGAVQLGWPLDDGWPSSRKLFPSKYILLLLPSERIAKIFFTNDGSQLFYFAFLECLQIFHPNGTNLMMVRFQNAKWMMMRYCCLFSSLYAILV